MPTERDYWFLHSALRTIRGPVDRGHWIDIYREVGGGYEGLQAIATAALSEVGGSGDPQEVDCAVDELPAPKIKGSGWVTTHVIYTFPPGLRLDTTDLQSLPEAER